MFRIRIFLGFRIRIFECLELGCLGFRVRNVQPKPDPPKPPKPHLYALHHSLVAAGLIEKEPL